MRISKRVGITVLLVVLSAATGVVLSPGGIESGATALQSNDVSTPGTAGMRAFVDPETGDLVVGPSPLGQMELDGEIANALSQEDEGLIAVRHADGSVSVDLQGRFQSASVARIDENGKVIVCTDNHADAKSILNESIAHPATPEVK